MNRKLIMVLAPMIALSACATPKPDVDIATAGDIVINGENLGSAKAAEMPALPENLARRALPLPPLTDPTLAGQQRSAIETDRAYNGVATQLNSVLTAWECVRKSLNDNVDPKECFK